MHAQQRRFETDAPGTRGGSPAGAGAQPQAPPSDLEPLEVIEMLRHELAGPLTNLTGFSGRLLKDLDDCGVTVTEERRHGLETLRREALRAQSITTLFLDLARLDAGPLPLDVAPVQVRRVVEAEVETLWDERHYAFISIECVADGDATIVDTDERYVRQIVGNLLSNALKYGGRPPEVRVRIETADGGVAVVVGDNGPGIPPEEQSRIFERFYRAPSTTRGQRGLGLGLYLSRRLADRLGGRITVRSAVGRGAEFRLWLPGLRSIDRTAARARRPEAFGA
jgi:signal transduction histidine kinase